MGYEDFKWFGNFSNGWCVLRRFERANIALTKLVVRLVFDCACLFCVVFDNAHGARLRILDGDEWPSLRVSDKARKLSVVFNYLQRLIGAVDRNAQLLA